jgi:hypothetical protein
MFHYAKQTRGSSMALKDLLSLCGRIGLVMAAFAFVSGIVAGPLLSKISFTPLTVTERGKGQAPLPQKPSVSVQVEKQG